MKAQKEKLKNQLNGCQDDIQSLSRRVLGNAILNAKKCQSMSYSRKCLLQLPNRSVSKNRCHQYELHQYEAVRCHSVDDNLENQPALLTICVRSRTWKQVKDSFRRLHWLFTFQLRSPLSNIEQKLQGVFANWMKEIFS